MYPVAKYVETFEFVEGFNFTIDRSKSKIYIMFPWKHSKKVDEEIYNKNILFRLEDNNQLLKCNILGKYFQIYLPEGLYYDSTENLYESLYLHEKYIKMELNILSISIKKVHFKE